MMDKLLIRIGFIVALLLPTGCAPDNTLLRSEPKHTGIDPEMLKYVHEYVKLYGPDDQSEFFKNRLSAAFSDFAGQTAGACWEFGPKRREIEIDLYTWAKSEPIERKFLFFHELTHCLCNRGHTWSGTKYGKVADEDNNKYVSKNGYFDEDSCPMSIMHPRMLPAHCLKDREAYYLNEMREGCNPSGVLVRDSDEDKPEYYPKNQGHR
jgi:hypothetical protein